MKWIAVRIWLAVVVLSLPAVSWPAPAQTGAPPRTVMLLDIDGPIGPAVTDLVRRGLADAGSSDAVAVVLRIDTPGGLQAATRDIVQLILAAPVPVISWVEPGGARAASAGTYILYATHVAAMAPGTHLGAATPVPIGGASPPAPTPDDAESGRSADDDDASPSAVQRKVLNDSAAYIRSLAELRGRNAEWAERAVRYGDSLTASEALQLGVIELIAADIDALLQQLDGRELVVGDRTVVLQTAVADVVAVERDWRNRLLGVLTDPSIAYLLLLAGLYGLLLEGYNPGALVPGVIGVVCLLVAAYALQVLPVNYAGLALIGLGLLLMVGELVTPSFGVLGIGGLVALVIGSVVLFDTDVPGFAVSRGLIGGIAVVGGAGLLLLLHLLRRSRQRPVSTGQAELLAATAVAAEDFQRNGRVHVRGELWQAQCAEPVRQGQSLRVVAVDGLRLRVEPLHTIGESSWK